MQPASAVAAPPRRSWVPPARASKLHRPLSLAEHGPPDESAIREGEPREQTTDRKQRHRSETDRIDVLYVHVCMQRPLPRQE